MVSSRLRLYPVSCSVARLSGRRTLRGGWSIYTCSFGCASIQNRTVLSQLPLYLLGAAVWLYPTFFVEQQSRRMTARLYCTGSSAREMQKCQFGQMLREGQCWADGVSVSDQKTSSALFCELAKCRNMRAAAGTGHTPFGGLPRTIVLAAQSFY